MSRSRRRNATPPPTPVRWTHVIPVSFLLIAGLGAFAAVAANTLMNARLDFDEVTAVIKAWWYITGSIAPYGTADSAPLMPVYPYALGAAQTFIGLSATAARGASMALGLANGLLIYLLCRKLTANTLASAAATAVFIGTPAAAFAFATATPLALAGLLHTAALWLLVASVGRPAFWRTLAMAAVLSLLVLTSFDMAIPAVLLALLFIAANGGARLTQGAVLVVVMAALIGATAALLPDTFLAFVDSQPLVRLLTGLAGGTAAFDAARFVGDLIEGGILPYAGLLVLCVIVFAQTLRGPRVLWIVPLYVLAALLAIAAFRGASCDACAATAPSAIMGMAALGSALAFGFLARWRRQKGGTGTAVVVASAVLALGANVFAPVVAERPSLHSFPAEMLKQSRPAAEQQDIVQLMRVIGENIPGRERVLLLHRTPGLPYAVHMAGRRFPAASLNPMAALRVLPASVTGAQRETMLAAIEQSGGWTGETLRRWIDRDFDAVILQDGVLTLDVTTTDMLTSRFEVAATVDFRGSKLTFYRRKG